MKSEPADSGPLDAGFDAEPAAASLAWRSRDDRSVLYHGDRSEIMMDIPDDSIDCIWTDPPYFLSNGGTTCVAGKRVRVDKGAWDRSQGLSIDHDFNRGWLRDCYRVLKPTGTIWVSGT
ncbi:MAG: DNA methyltransferase, partial [Gammaproteobacteria bacterium]